MQGFISQELTWVESHLLCAIWSVVKGEGCRQLLLTSLLLANNRYLRGRLPEELSKLPWQTKAKVQKVMRAQPQGGLSRCASRRDHGGCLEAPLCHGHRGKSLWRPALSGPLQFTTLPGSIDLFLAFVSGTRSQLWASQTNVCTTPVCDDGKAQFLCTILPLGLAKK